MPASEEVAFLDALVNAIPDPIIVTREDGQVVRLNRAATQLFGAPPRKGATENTSQRVFELLPFLPTSPHKRGLRLSWEGVVLDRQGREHQVRVRRAPGPYGEKPPRDLYVLHDISPLVEANWWREQVLYTLAHEVAGSFTVLQHALELVAGDRPAGEADRLIRYCQETVDKMQSLLDDVLAAGSIRGGRFHVNPQPVRLATLVAEAADSVRLELTVRDQEIERALSPDVWVAADPRSAGRVLVNLLRNASKYSPGQTAIRIAAQVSKRGWVRVSVRDQGAGIPAEERRWIFERFYRVRPGSPEAGVGVGLAIARGIIQAHGGRMGITSRPGKGTTIWFTLPVVDAP
jgi:signal transduction histidine kinase